MVRAIRGSWCAALLAVELPYVGEMWLGTPPEHEQSLATLDECGLDIGRLLHAPADAWLRGPSYAESSSRVAPKPLLEDIVDQQPQLATVLDAQHAFSCRGEPAGFSRGGHRPKKSALVARGCSHVCRGDDSLAESRTLVPMPRIDWLDYVRLICAILVMLDHYLVIGPDPAITRGVSSFGPLTEVVRFGTVALCVFMMISGMMITLVAQRQSASAFTIGRFARLYPTFLLCMIVTAMLSPLGPQHFYDSWGQTFANLFIYAPAFGYRYVDTVYWALVIEINFYIAMMLLIATGGLRHLQPILVIWLGLQIVSLFIGPQLPLIGRDYYFVTAGVVMALLYQRRNERLNLALLGISLLLCLQTSTAYAHAWGYDAVIAGALTTGIFAVFLLMRGRSWNLPFAHRIGSMTYSLYLLHFSLGMTIFHWWMTDGNKWPLMLATSALFIALAFAIDDIMEFRLRPIWRRIAAGTVARPLIWWEGRKLPSNAS